MQNRHGFIGDPIEDFKRVADERDDAHIWALRYALSYFRHEVYSGNAGTDSGFKRQ